MLRTIEAVIDEKGNVRLLEPVRLPAGRRVLITILEDSVAEIPEPALAEDWNRPEEDEAWSHLQQEASS